MELSVRPIRACLLQGTVSMGYHPRGGGGSTGRGMEQPAAPVSCVSPKTSFHASSRPTPASLSHLPSMPSRKKPHDAAVTRGIPHEDGGSVFIQIPATPRNRSMDRPWTVHGEVYQTSVAVGLMASPGERRLEFLCSLERDHTFRDGRTAGHPRSH